MLIYRELDKISNRVAGYLRAYLGKSEDMTLERLDAIAVALSGAHDGAKALDVQEGERAADHVSLRPFSSRMWFTFCAVRLL